MNKTMTNEQQKYDQLISHRTTHGVSIWMPAHRGGMEVRQDPIRLRNLIDKADSMLRETGVRTSKAREILEPARNLDVDGDFWRHQNLSLGVFADEGLFETIRLPGEAAELVTIGANLHVKPILRMLGRDQFFYLLALSEKAVTLYRGSRHVFEPVSLPRAPGSFAEAARFDQMEEHIEVHSGGAPHGPSGSQEGIYHGQGAGVDEAREKRRLTEYCRLIDDGLARRLAGERAPLLLAATEPLAGIFRQTTSYGYVDDRTIEGCPDPIPAETLHRKAMDLVQATMDRPFRDAVNRLGNAVGASMATSDIRRVLKAAHAAAVDTLFVASDRQFWGTFDAQTEATVAHDDQAAGDEDLLNAAAAMTHRHGGQVFVDRQENLPGESAVSAILRFKLAQE